MGKLKHLEKRPLTPWAKVLAMAFKVFHSRDEKAWKQKDPILRKAFWLALATAQAPWPPKAPEPLCSCFKCGQEGHWTQACLNSHIAPDHVQGLSRRLFIRLLTDPMSFIAWGHQSYNWPYRSGHRQLREPGLPWILTATPDQEPRVDMAGLGWLISLLWTPT